MEELLVMFLISGVILVGISIPLIRGKIAPNSLYGFRVRDTLDDPKTWYAANTYSGKWLLGTGLIFIATCHPGVSDPRDQYRYLFPDLPGRFCDSHDHRGCLLLAVHETGQAAKNR